MQIVIIYYETEFSSKIKMNLLFFTFRLTLITKIKIGWNKYNEQNIITANN